MFDLPSLFFPVSRMQAVCSSVKGTSYRRKGPKLSSISLLILIVLIEQVILKFLDIYILIWNLRKTKNSSLNFALLSCPARIPQSI